MEVQEHISPLAFGAAQRYNVLVVDDEVLVRWSAARALERVGLNVAVAATAEEAFSMLDREVFHTLITDMRLPTKDGFDVAARARSVNPNCAVVLMSAFRDDAINQRAHERGFDCFLDKPLNLPEVVGMVTRIKRKQELGSSR